MTRFHQLQGKMMQMIRFSVLAAAAALAWAATPPVQALYQTSQPQTIDLADAAVSHVTLYQGRAAVTRIGSASLEPGTYALRFGNLPKAIAPESLQARLNGLGRVIGVDYAEQKQSGESSPKVAELDKQIEQLQSELNALHDQRAPLILQAEFLAGLTKRAATEAGRDAGTERVDLEAVRQQLAFLAEESARLAEARRLIDDKQQAIEKQLAKVKAERDKLAADTVERIATITAVITEAGDVTAQLTYLTYEATWEPAYNIRAAGDLSSMTVEYDAVITQRTGEDWNDVRLTLSTAQPTAAAHPPTIQPWFVDVARPDPYTLKSVAMEATPAAAPPAHRLGLAMDSEAAITGSGPAVAFVLPRTATVKSDSQRQQRVRIASIDAPVKFRHVAVPLLSDSVYLRGDLVNSSAYQLLPGKASVFLDQDFIGPTRMDSVPPAGEFKAHFGIDRAVKVARQLVAKKTESTGLLGGGRRTSYDYRISIDNGTGRDITLELWDRYPVSRSSEIQIDLVDLAAPLASDAKYVEEEKPQGLLKWLLAVPASATGSKASVITYGVRVNRAKDVETTPLPE